MDRTAGDSMPAAASRSPGLLVSVRSALEARTAVAGGADLVDIKDPARGSLGRPTPDVIAAVASEIGAARPLSVALGELPELEPGACESQSLCLTPRLSYAKLGLAGAGGTPRWWRSWEQAWSGLPSRVGRVGVLYADWQVANTPPPEEALRVFAAAACSAVLVDTFAKDGRSLLDCIAPADLSGWVGQAREAGSAVVLAGSLSIRSLDRLTAYQPDYVAIRSAACRGGRGGSVSLTRTRRFAAALRQVFIGRGIPCIFPADG